MIRKLFTLLLAALVMPMATQAQDEPRPTIEPSATSTSDSGDAEAGTTFTGSAPKTVHFFANAQNVGAWNAYYEWRFYLTHLDGHAEDTPYLIRYEEDTEVTFTKAGLHKVMLYATFTQGTDTIAFADEYWAEKGPLTVSISESKLEMPNAFSPNDDTVNDVYKPKKDYQSIVEFKATIYNRWGQKLYEWTNPAEGWDGTYNGHPVKQGVYFCHVVARGADGRKFNIRTDVNLLRGFTLDTGVNNP